VVRVGLIGLGKMGLSHCALLRAHPEVELAGICDSSGIALGVLTRYTGLRGFTDYREMLDQCELDAVVIATPSKSHAALVDDCLDRSLSVFCEKPFTLDADDSERLAQRASQLGVATHVGYHNRSVAAFAEVKRLLDAGAIGTVTQVLGEAYGPVVLRPKGGTWRSQRAEGGGCLYDYAAHVIDLLTWYLGPPQGVRGTVLTSVFSRDTDDQVTTNLIYPDDLTAQLSVNWSDESVRKMSTSLTLRGTNGRIYVDRQECQVYLRTPVASLPG
jgi:scyllo-inositol 2-dehydrogenase (NADP+)